jgi:NAD(P)-dependent dehydrogenase (short-subunit alcohol dehydrogenase family)
MPQAAPPRFEVTGRPTCNYSQPEDLKQGVLSSGAPQAVEKEFFQHVRPSSLLKRFTTVDEVAAMATYLAGEPSSATNGAALRVDGGVLRAIL